MASFLPLVAGLLILPLLPAGEAPQGPPPTPVRVVTVQEQAVQETTRLVGSLIAAQRLSLPAEEAGRLAAVLVDVGDPVGAGQELTRIDGERLEAALAETEALVQAAQAAVAESAEALARAEADAKALAQAAEQRAASAIEARRAENSRTEAQAALQRAEADLAAAEARRQMLRVRQGDLVGRAPFAGAVVARHVDPGAWLAQGQALLELSSTDLEVAVAVPERFWPGVQAHARELSVLVEAADRRQQATGLRIVPALDPASRTFRVIAPLPGDSGLAAGLSVLVDLPVGPAATHLVVPAAAVLRGGGDFLYAVRRTGEGPAKAARVAVQVLFATSDGLAITADGLQAGEQVVVEGNERLHPGAVVQVQPVADDQP